MGMQTPRLRHCLQCSNSKNMERADVTTNDSELRSNMDLLSYMADSAHTLMMIVHNVAAQSLTTIYLGCLCSVTTSCIRFCLIMNNIRTLVNPSVPVQHICAQFYVLSSSVEMYWFASLSYF